MDIQISNINFGCKISLLSAGKNKCVESWFRSKFLKADTFTRTTFDVNKDLKKVRLKEKINEGRSAKVYATNFDGYVVRIMHGRKFNSKELVPFNDPNGLIVAQDQYHLIELMKFIKGEPLYGTGWDILNPISKQEYMNEFEKIQSLPDETFSQYIRDIVNIRRNGCDIDDVNPNNFLLDGEHIGIVDLKYDSNTKPEITVNDFYPLINKHHLLKMFKCMDMSEVQEIAGKIKDFYDRMALIVQKEGYNLNMPVADDCNSSSEVYLINYLYYKNLDKIKNLIDMK